VDTNPSGASVELLDTQGAVLAQGTTPFFSQDLPTGPYTLRFRKTLYRAKELPAQAPDGNQTADLATVDLEPESEHTQSYELLTRMHARLLQPLAEELNLPKMPFSMAAEFLTDRLQLKIDFDRKALEEDGYGLDMPVEGVLTQEPLLHSFNRFLAQYDLVAMPVPESPTFRLQITTQHGQKSQHSVVIYPVDDVLERGNWDALIETITTQIAPTEWDDVGGPGTITPGPGATALTVRNTWAIHLQIFELLQEMRRTRLGGANRPQSPADAPVSANEKYHAQELPAAAAAGNQTSELLTVARSSGHAQSYEFLIRMHEQLCQPLAEEVSFQTMPLSKFVEDVAARLQLNIDFDRLALMDSGIPLSLPVEGALTQEPLIHSVNRCLSRYGLVAMPIPDGQRFRLRVTTDRREETQHAVVIYTLDDAIAESNRDALISSITTKIAPASWGQGSLPGAITLGPGAMALTVRNTWRIHLQIFELLQEMRRDRLAAKERQPAPADASSAVQPASAQPAPALQGNGDANAAEYQKDAAWLFTQGNRAKVVLAYRGTAMVGGREQVVRTQQTLPSEPFWVTRVNLNGANVTDRDLAQFGDAFELRWLSILGTKAQGFFLAQLQECKKLAYLELNQSQVNDAGLAVMPHFPALRELHLSGCAGVGDAGVSRIAQMTGGVQTLSLLGTQVTDDGLAPLGSLASLQTLYLTNTAITDAGLKHLQACKSLRRLYLENTKTTSAGIDALRSALPGCQVQASPQG
jgi:hypothetical protein